MHGHLYTCQLFLRYKCEIFILGFLKTTQSFLKIPEEVQSLPKKSKDFRRRLKSSEDFQSLPKAKLSSPSLRTRISVSLLPVLFTSKIRDREEVIVIYSFYTWFSFLTWVWVNIFLEIVSSKMATTHIFQSGMRNWPASMRRREIEVFNPQAWDSRLRRESWQVYTYKSFFAVENFRMVIPKGVDICLQEMVIYKSELVIAYRGWLLQ